MNNYNITAETETQKYNIINIIRQAGAVLTGVSGCGTAIIYRSTQRRHRRPK